MSDDFGKLKKAAKQVLDAELMLGGDFLPACGRPLPERSGVRSPESGGTPTTTAGTVVAVAVAAPDSRLQTPDSRLQTTDSKAHALDVLKQEVEACLKCQLCSSRSHVVFGEGNPDAQLLFVGEAPGADEDASGRPFVGRAGQKLTEMITAMGLTREDVYICNILKCRPPDNRPPAPEEVVTCWDFLIRQLQIIRPRVIVTLGNPATQNLLKTTVGITKLRGQWQKLPNLGEGLEGIPVMPTFHPSYILRMYTPETRRMVWSDLQQVMKLLGLKRPTKQS